MQQPGVRLRQEKPYMVDGEGDCDKGLGRDRCYRDMIQGAYGGLDGLLAWPLGRGNGGGEGTDRRRLRPKEDSQLSV